MAPPRLLARFDDMARAREAMVALRNAGIDAADVDLVGETAARPSRRSRRRRPKPIVGRVRAALASVFGARGGVERSTGLSDPWELTFQEGAGRSAWIAVYGGNIAKAHHVLAEQGAAAFRRPADLEALGRLFTGIDTGRRPA